MNGWQETKAGNLVIGARMLGPEFTITEVTGIEHRDYKVRIGHSKSAGGHIVLHEAESVWACMPEAT